MFITRREFNMKKLSKFLGIIAVLAVIGFTMAACDDGSGGGGSSPFSGTWIGFDSDYENLRLRLTGSGWTATWPDIDFGPFSGSYTYGGNTLTFSRGGSAIGTATVQPSGNQEMMSGMLILDGYTLGFAVLK